MSTTPITEEQALQLQALLIGLIEITKAKMKEIGVDNLSFHLCPDSSWCAMEHEAITPTLVRLPPSCHTIITKL